MTVTALHINNHPMGYLFGRLDISKTAQRQQSLTSSRTIHWIKSIVVKFGNSFLCQKMRFVKRITPGKLFFHVGHLQSDGWIHPYNPTHIQYDNYQTTNLLQPGYIPTTRLPFAALPQKSTAAFALSFSSLSSVTDHAWARSLAPFMEALKTC